MNRLLTIFGLMLAFTALPADLITATVTLTNATTSGATLAVSSGTTSTRTFTNSTSATTITTNGTAGGSATNAFLALAQYPPPGALALYYNGTNSFKLRAPSGSPLTVTLSAGIGSVIYATQLVSDLVAVRVPLASEGTPQSRTNIGTGILDALAYSTNAASQTITALSNYVSLHGTQTLSNKTLRTSRLDSPVVSSGIITNLVVLSGNLGRTTNGSNYYGWFYNPTLAGATNAGNSFVSYGDNVTGLQLGYGSQAAGAYTVAAGYQAKASNSQDIAVGYQAEVEAGSGSAIGNGARVLSPWGIAIGSSAFIGTNASTSIAFGTGASVENADNAGAIGQSSSATHDDSYALGSESVTTKAGQLVLGSTYTTDAWAPYNLIAGQNLMVGGDLQTAPASLVYGLTFTNGTAASADPANGASMWSVGGSWQYRTSGSGEGSGITAHVHNRAAEVIGSGTDYSLTTTHAFVNFGGTDPEFNTLPTAGTYLITAIVAFTDGAVADDAFYFKLYDATAAADIANSEVHLEGDGGNHHMQCVVQSVVTLATASRIQLYGRNATAARGTVESIHTKLTYVRLY